MRYATTAAAKSDIGIAIHTPSSPSHCGIRYNAGTRNNNCRDRLRKMLTFALPMDWKKFVITICAPIMQNMHIIYRRAVIDIAIRVSSVVKRRDTRRGNIMQSKKPEAHIAVPEIMDSFNTSRRRLKFCAP